MPLNTATPSAIAHQLDQYVIGQDEAKRTLAVAVYSHYRKILITAQEQVIGALNKSNILLIGQTGTGKTLMCETLARILKVPFVSANATSLAQSKYVNDEIEAVLQRLVDSAKGDIDEARYGIVFIDEIDKLKTSNNPGQAISGESVQHALLKIMEGSAVKLNDNRYIDTSGVLFICAGTFVGLEKIMDRTGSFGFISSTGGSDQSILDRLNQRVKPTDLLEYGLIPEFTGRLPVITKFGNLSKEMLVRIMTEPKNSIFNQFRQIFKNEGAELKVEPRVFEQIADIAFEYKTGARSLRGIFEELISPILYLIPDHPEIQTVMINSLFEEPRFLGKPA